MECGGTPSLDSHAAKMSEKKEKGRLQEFSEETTLHGFRYLTSEGSIVHRLLWLVLLIGGTILMVYQVKSSLESSLSSSVDDEA